MTKIYSNDIPANQRAWYAQRYKPTACKFKCGNNIVFMKAFGGGTIACEARKILVTAGDMKIMCEDGTISKEGRRFGWPVHVCPKDPKMIAEKKMKGEQREEIPLPEWEPVYASPVPPPIEGDISKRPAGGRIG